MCGIGLRSNLSGAAPCGRPGVTHVYRQLAAHLSLVHSNGALLHRALQSFPNLTFAEDEACAQTTAVARQPKLSSLRR